MLEHGTDVQLLDYLRDQGLAAATDAAKHLDWAMRGDTRPEFERSRERFLPVLRRLGTTLKTTNDVAYVANLAGFIETLDPELGWSRALRVEETGRIDRDSARSPHEKLSAFLGLADWFADLGDSLNAARVTRKAYYEALRAQDIERSRLLANRALALSRTAEDPTLECQVLGYLAFLHEFDGDVDSTLVVLQDALELAIEHRDAVQAARACGMLAAQYRGRGLLSLAGEYEDLGLAYCQEFRAGIHELRFLTESMENDVDRGAWAAVERKLDRARGLRARMSQHQRDGSAHLLAPLAAVESRFLAARGDSARALTIAEDHFQLGWASPLPNVRAEAALSFIDVLGVTGRPARVLELADMALADSLISANPRLPPEFWSRKSRAFIDLKEWEQVSRSLAVWQAVLSTSDLAGPLDSLEIQLCRIECLSEAGPASDLPLTMKNAFDLVGRIVAAQDLKHVGYLASSAGRRFRDLLLRLNRHDPHLMYLLDLGWRGARRWDFDWTTVGEGEAPHIEGNFPGSVHRHGADAADAINRYLSNPRRISDGHYLRYYIGPKHALRWHVTPYSVVFDTLDVSSSDLTNDVRSAVERLTRDPDPGSECEADLQKALRHLAHVLLPDQLRATGGVGRVLVSGDAVLNRLPFSVLDVGEAEAYVPLIAVAEVASLRSPIGHRSTTLRDCVIVGNPRLRPELLSRYPSLSDLQWSEEEATLAAQVLSGARLLTGAQATKKELQEEWNDSRVIYLACHVVQDGDDLYRMFIPLAPEGSDANDSSSSLGDDRIELRDIYEAAFEGCELVVLSGCASGSYPSGAEQPDVPTLAEGFLDRGAHAVVHTLWRVRDEVGLLLMRGFVMEWNAQSDPVAALTAQQRTLLSDTTRRGLRHPFHWGAYSVALSVLPTLE